MKTKKLGKAKLNVGFLYILPWFLGFLIFKLYPFARSVYFSFTDYNLLKAPKFVLFQNYISIFTSDKEFWPSLFVTFKYVLLVVPLKIVIALFVALLIVKSNRINYFFRSIYYLPSILGGSVAVSMIWKLFFAENGVVNGLLSKVGVKSIEWLSPSLALVTISLLNIWQFGATMVLFVAAIKSVPNDLYEAATVDGIGRIGKFFKITLPMISSVVFFNLLMGLVTAFQEFNAPLLITNGGPLKATNLYGYMLYSNAFVSFKMGYACAQSWILFAIILVLTILIFKTQKYWTYYEDGGKF